MYNISISTCFDYSLPIETQLPMIQKAGYKYVSIGANYAHSGILDKYRLTDLKMRLSDHDLCVDTIHGYHMDMADAIEINQKIVDAATQLGAPIVVVHCSSFTFDASTINERRADITKKLLIFEKIARDSGVKFAIENVLPGVATDFMEEIIGKTNPEYFGFCYDSSHDQIDGPRPFDLLERLADRLIAIHISDRIKEFVDHVIPGEGFIDFDRLCLLLNKASIKFPFLMELMTANSKYNVPVKLLKVSFCEAVRLCEKIYF